MKTIIPTPTIGRIVLYVLTGDDADYIAEQRKVTEDLGFDHGRGNPVASGEIYPAIIVRQWGGDRPDASTTVNLKILLDGADHIWLTSVAHSAEKVPGTFHWPVYPVQLEARVCGSAGEALPLAETLQS